MKKYKLKGWVEYTLIAIALIALVVMLIDFENIYVYAIVKISCISIALFNDFIVQKYGQLSD